MSIKVLKVLDLGNDVLEVQGFDSENPAELLFGYGWVSAIMNHYEKTDYSKDGHRRGDAKSHRMTSDQKHKYFLSLLEPSEESESIYEDSVALSIHKQAVADRDAQETAIDEDEAVIEDNVEDGLKGD